MFAVVLLSLTAVGASLSPEEAMKHIGEHVTVCCVVASAYYAARSKSQPTFLELDKPYPSQVFTAVILGNDRAKFGTPETTLQGKQVCVTGSIRIYRGKPAVILHDARQLGVVSKNVVDGIKHE
jgi:hypothetical protein